METRALEVAQLYAQRNSRAGHQAWDATAYLLGLIGDLGSLAKTAMENDNYRPPTDGNDIGHHLADCLYSIILVAQTRGADLEWWFTVTMDKIKEDLRKEMEITS